MQTETNKKRLGTFLITAICLLIGAFALWQEHPFLALLAVAFGIPALLLEDGALYYRTVLLISMVLLMVALVIYHFAPDVVRVETEVHGWLLPASEPTPPNTCDAHEKIPLGSLLFVAGTNAIVSTSQGKSLVISVGNNNQLFVERDGDKLAFDAEIHDNSGSLVARVIRNEFHLISGEYSYQERSDDRSKLTVYDKQGNEMLYVDYANPTTVIIRGMFVGQDGTRVKIDSNQILILDVDNQIMDTCKVQGDGPTAGFHLSRSGMRF